LSLSIVMTLAFLMRRSAVDCAYDPELIMIKACP
jgi:hypothetical protein